MRRTSRSGLLAVGRTDSFVLKAAIQDRTGTAGTDPLRPFEVRRRMSALVGEATGQPDRRYVISLRSCEPTSSHLRTLVGSEWPLWMGASSHPAVCPGVWGSGTRVRASLPVQPDRHLVAPRLDPLSELLLLCDGRGGLPRSYGCSGWLLPVLTHARSAPSASAGYLSAPGYCTYP